MKTHLKKLAIQAAFAACALSASATDYYWTGVTSTTPGTLTNWSSTLDGTGVMSTAWNAAAGDNIYLSDIATVTNRQIALISNATFGTLTNARTATAVSGGWEIYGATGAGQSYTWNFGSIVQNSSTSLMLRKGQNGTDLFVNVTGDVSVLAGTLNIGTTGTALQYISTATIGGNVSLAAGTTLNLNTKNANSIAGTLTNTGGTLYTVTGLTVGGAVTNSGVLNLNGTSTFNSAVTNTGNINLGSTTFNGVSADFKEGLTSTNGNLNFLFGNNVATITAKSIASTTNTGSYNIQLGQRVLTGNNALNATVNVYSSTDTANRLLSVSAGDLSIIRTNAETAANIGTLNVKSNLYTGATGTFTYSGGTSSTNRIRLLVQDADIDNFIAGDASGANNTYVEITRGQNITDGSALGTVKIGNLTTLANLADFRVGYMNTDAVGYTSFTKYQTIDIGTANIAKGAEFVAENINVGALNKTSSSNNILLGVSANGVGATSIVLGADSNSVINNYGGIIYAYTKNLTINGALNLAASSTLGTTFTKGNSNTLAGVAQTGDVDIGNLNFDTTTATATATLNTNIVNNNIDNLTFKGSANGTLNFGGTSSAHIGNITVNRWTNSESADQSTVNAYVSLNSAADIDAVNINSGIGGAALLTITRNTLNIQGNNSAATTLHIDTLNMQHSSSLSIGTGSYKLGNVTIDTLNQTQSASTAGVDYDHATAFNLVDGANVSITDFNVIGGIGRFWSNADSNITNLNINNGTSSGAYIVTTGKTLTINKIDFTSGSTHRIGGDTERASAANITTLNHSASNVFSIWTVNNDTTATANVTTLNMLNASATTALFQNTNIGTLNFGAAGTGGTVTNTGATTIGAINVANVTGATVTSSLDMNATVTGTINVEAGAALNLAKNTNGYTVTTAGVTATSTSNMTRITTNKNATLAFNGTGSYSFTGCIHDFGASVTSVTPGVAEISIIKNGTGTQILRGQNYYRGTTTVNEGALYISADGASNTLGLGLGAVVLNGGRLGAISQASSVGTIKATGLTWSNAAQLDFDIASASSFDKIILSGDFLKGTGTGDYVFNFTFDGGTVIADTQFDILTWDGTTDFSDTDSFVANFTGSENYDAVFSVTDGVLSVTFSAIPEPAQFAALFGLAALLFAIRRRRK